HTGRSGLAHIVSELRSVDPAGLNAHDVSRNRPTLPQKQPSSSTDLSLSYAPGVSGGNHAQVSAEAAPVLSARQRQSLWSSSTVRIRSIRLAALQKGALTYVQPPDQLAKKAYLPLETVAVRAE